MADDPAVTDPPAADPPAADPPADPPAADPPVAGATQAEVDKAYAKLREAEKARKAAEDQLAAQARAKAEEEGRFKELAEQEKARADRLEAEKQQTEQRRLAERAATDLKFKDTGYALYLLDQDRTDLSDAAAVRAALEQLAQNRKDLITGTPPPPSGGPAGGDKGQPPALTRERIESMTADQLKKIDPKVIDEALAASQ